ncbi:hypothetical protein PUNSTDRAFT_138320 [Punctularia strigosozonata HHB-11173 SS5]|uniref:Uncharacterized protein n=1 Tax=Punctularia strigosozonata (strain HHB-11173) TaxID=741275 RepID=R7S4E3_PUNST|nr:uncharacterized protein PUNSTDRAFT_138320 [Punctularia strigosozonata HHB-11173 SS5]EIN04672.1 hypothetical protein PUNSTDRAFT_138320 [Punctularia strigosozonata HHB-11173 SS5]
MSKDRRDGWRVGLADPRAPANYELNAYNTYAVTAYGGAVHQGWTNQNVVHYPVPQLRYCAPEFQATATPSAARQRIAAPPTGNGGMALGRPDNSPARVQGAVNPPRPSPPAPPRVNGTINDNTQPSAVPGAGRQVAALQASLAGQSAPDPTVSSIRAADGSISLAKIGDLLAKGKSGDVRVSTSNPDRVVLTVEMLTARFELTASQAEEILRELTRIRS